MGRMRVAIAVLLCVLIPLQSVSAKGPLLVGPETFSYEPLWPYPGWGADPALHAGRGIVETLISLLAVGIGLSLCGGGAYNAIDSGNEGLAIPILFLAIPLVIIAVRLIQGEIVGGQARQEAKRPREGE